MRNTGLVAGLLGLTFVILGGASSASAEEHAREYTPAIALQQPTTTPAETGQITSPAPEQDADTDNNPLTFSAITTYLSTAILFGAIAWSAWYQRRKRR